MSALADPHVLIDRFLEEWVDALPPESAVALANWRASAELQAELDAYAERAGQAELSREQRRGYDEFTTLTSLASLLRAGAAVRAGLLQPSPARSPGEPGAPVAAEAA